MKDLAPIDQKWIHDYCDQFLKIATSLGESRLKQAVLLRVEHCMDLTEAWQNRNNPIGERKK